MLVYPPPEQSQRQMQRILHSATFRNAHTLQRLLEFLVTQAYGPDAEALKEYTIGVGVLSKPQDFDPKTDPIVRVQTHRLRQKLQEYYEIEGRHDPIVIAIPKGHYLPAFEEVADLYGTDGRGSSPAADMTASAEPDAAHPLWVHSMSAADGPPALAQPESRRLRFGNGLFRRAVVAGVVVVAVFAAGFWVGTSPPHFPARFRVASASSELGVSRSSDPVRAFWAGVIGSDATPIIAHADAVFLLDSHNDLFWFPNGASDYRGAPVDPHLARQFAANPELVAQAGKLYYENVYLGSGDLDAVGILSNLFGQMGIRPVIEPGRDLTSDDLKQHSVILIGSSFQSYAVSQFNSLGDFTFVNPDVRRGGWQGTIVNAHPRPGEQAVYRTVRDPATGVLTTDHALITVQPGVAPGRYVADLGGIDTTGSEGAAMFATSQTGVEELSKALAAQGIRSASGAPPLFQALLSVRLAKGNEVLGASLLTVHPLLPAQKAPVNEH